MALRSTIKMPKLGDTVDEVLVVEWLAPVGATVAVGDPLMTVETDKVDAEVPTPVAGRLVKQLVQPQDQVATGSPIAVVESG